MIGRIMLHKNTLLFAALSAALWGTTAQDVNAAVVASLKPLGFIASGAEPEELNIEGTYHDLQYMSLRNPMANDWSHGDGGAVAA